MAETKCKSCGAPIVWIRAADTKRWIPCNEGLVPYKQGEHGDSTVVTDKGEVIRCYLDFVGLPTGLARIAHFATCPNADKHRRKKNGK